MVDLIDVFVLDALAVSESCPMCEEFSTAMTAIDIAIDGDQIASDCAVCGRLVRSFSWHDDELPVAYVGRFDHHGGAVEASAWYRDTGSVRSVPAVDDDCPWRHSWPRSMEPLVLARAMLAHLVGLDVPEVVWSEFATDLIVPLVVEGGEWMLSVDDIAEWLAANR